MIIEECDYRLLLGMSELWRYSNAIVPYPTRWAWILFAQSALASLPHSFSPLPAIHRRTTPAGVPPPVVK
jgi:hypothetical protein